MKGVADEHQPYSSAGSLEPVPATRVERRAQFEGEVLVHLDALYAFALKLARIPADAEPRVRRARSAEVLDDIDVPEFIPR